MISEYYYEKITARKLTLVIFVPRIALVDSDISGNDANYAERCFIELAARSLLKSAMDSHLST